jgi:hypothetical protein
VPQPGAEHRGHEIADRLEQGDVVPVVVASAVREMELPDEMSAVEDGAAERAMDRQVALGDPVGIVLHQGHALLQDAPPQATPDRAGEDHGLAGDLAPRKDVPGHRRADEVPFLADVPEIAKLALEHPEQQIEDVRVHVLFGRDEEDLGEALPRRFEIHGSRLVIIPRDRLAPGRASSRLAATGWGRVRSRPVEGADAFAEWQARQAQAPLTAESPGAASWRPDSVCVQ